jgi:anaerobic sulfite reductase subunit C
MAGMSWDKDAEKELKRVPFFARGMVRRKVGERVRKRGEARVTLADFKEAESRFKSVMSGKSTSELKHMLPAENVSGAEMVVLENCQHQLSDCPNVLTNTEPWRNAINEWLAEKNISERLRARIKGERILYHQKLRISISGCPNQCSRPQIADIGLHGFARPLYDPEECNSCGDCQTACPDFAVKVDKGPAMFDLSVCLGCTKCRDACAPGCISLTKPEVRVMAGGKLGRRPHLAETVADVKSPEDLIPILEQAVESYLKEAKPEERFADFWLRSKGR